MQDIEKKKDIMFLAKSLHRILDANFNSYLEKIGLTPQQGRIILYIGKKKTFDGVDVNQKMIENRFELSRSTVSGLIDRLEDKRLLKRVPNGKSFNLVLTDESLELIEEIDKSKDKCTEVCFTGISQEEKDIVSRVLNTIINNLKGEN